MKNLLALILICFVSAMVMAEEKSTLPVPSSGNVTLSLAEYNRLVDLAAKAIRKHEQPPIPYTIKRADLKLRVGNESVLGTVLLDGEVFNKGAAKVPLTTGMTVLNAHQEGKPLPLLQEGTVSTAVLPGASDFSVTLDTGLPLAIEAGRASFNLPVPAAGSVRLSLVIPGDHTNVRISPGLITSRTSDKGQTTVEAALVPGQTADVWWATREIAAPVVPREVRFLSDVKTLVSVSEADLKIAVLADITVVQGEPAQFTVSVPEDFEITEVTGATVESSEVDGNTLTIKLSEVAQRSHQFLISMEKPLSDSKADAPFISFKDAQRETGEALVEGAGAMELTAKEAGSLKRMDVREINPFLRSLAHSPLQAAFRYHRQVNEAPSLALSWTRFPDSNVLAAIAEHAVVTTLVTSEGRSLTEVKLTLKNTAQPFMKIDLPAGATILSADVAGEKVKPVQGTDGNRVPLLRPNFRPADAYTVSFVFMHSGSPFAKKGGSEISLPSMDVPIGMLEWEIFLPEQFQVKDFGGDAIFTNLLSPVVMQQSFNQLNSIAPGVVASSGALAPGQLGGVIIDQSGAVISNAAVTVKSLETGITRTARTNSLGQWVVSAMPSGRVRIEASAPGFRNIVYSNTPYDAERPSEYSITLTVSSATETVEVTAVAPMIDTTTSGISSTVDLGGASNQSIGGPRKRDEKKAQAQQQNQPSANVFNLQKKVAGVLPVRVDVPHAGNSYRFARTLVLDEETKLTFNYKTR